MDEVMSIKEMIIQVVNRIPRGSVASYGQVAQVVSAMAEKTISAQIVWSQLSAMPKSDRWLLPRWRVVNRDGEITSIKLGKKWTIQKMMLQDDGILVYDYQVAMERYQVDQELIAF